MVDVNFGRLNPTGLLDLSRVVELSEWSLEGDVLRLGAGITFARLLEPGLAAMVPALAQAARTVGSPQIRQRATLGGNLATGSPAGDSIPPLVAHLAEIELASVRGRRRMPLGEFILGPKRTALRSDELILSVSMRYSVGAQTFMKVGARSAMVISVASIAMLVDDERDQVRVGYGSAGPTVGLVCSSRAAAAGLPGAVENACVPIDDVRASARYRRRALRVMTERALERCVG
jgi:CO/xanthine dehydrogenase FAD-binding subunit